MAKLNSVTIDCHDAEVLAQFWAKALDGYSVDAHWAKTSDGGATIFFQKVPEARSVRGPSTCIS